MMVLMRSMGRNLMGEFFSESAIDLTMFSSSFAISGGPAILHVKTHAPAGWRADRCRTSRPTPSIGAYCVAVQHQRSWRAHTCRCGLFALKRLQYFGQLVGGDVLEEDQIEHGPVVFGDAVGVGLASPEAWADAKYR